VLTQKEVHAVKNQGTVKARRRWLPDWCFGILLVIIGLAFDWDCAFERFSGRYTLFSGPVLGVLVLIVVLYTSLAFLAARLSGRGKWLEVVGFFELASLTLSGNILW
jgi:hypothetical protein